VTITGGPIELVLPAPQEIVGFSDVDVVEGIAAAQVAIAMLQAVQVRMIGRLNQLRDGDRSVADEVAPELGMSRHGAQRLVGLSDDLLTRLPCTLSAMDRGELDVYKASKITDVTAPLSPEKCREVDGALAGRLAGKDPAQIRRAARDLVHRIDGDGANERAVKRREDRKIELCHEDDAMATLLAYLPAETASAIYSRVDTIARTVKTPGEDRTLEQLRADVLSDLLLGKLTGHCGVLGTIFLHIPIGTALGITEHGCVLEGHGPVPGEIARRILNDPSSVWRKVLTDPGSGAVLDVGRTRRRPPAALSELVRVRDRECRMIGCHRPAHRCELDHVKPWHAHGITSSDNLDCLCRRHNLAKERPGWDFSYDPGTGELTVTTPAGRAHRSLPEPLSPAIVEKTDGRIPVLR
jgi:hypothetical protein